MWDIGGTLASMDCGPRLHKPLSTPTPISAFLISMKLAAVGRVDDFKLPHFRGALASIGSRPRLHKPHYLVHLGRYLGVGRVDY